MVLSQLKELKILLSMNPNFRVISFLAIMPGIMIVEALAQTAAVMVGVSLDLADKNLLIYFMGIDKCKFRRKVVPGDTMS